MLLTALEQASEVGRSQRPAAPAAANRGVAERADPDEARIASLTARERQLIFAMMCNSTEPGKVIADRL